MNPQHLISRSIISFLLLLVILLCSPGIQAECTRALSSGELVYVSIYSNVYTGPKGIPFQLAAMLSLRNTDPHYAITIDRADYYDSSGKKIDSYLQNTVQLTPLASSCFYIKEHDTRGGPGANFLVRWHAETKVNQPVIEGVMLGLTGGQGVSFICPGQVITNHGYQP